LDRARKLGLEGLIATQRFPVARSASSVIGLVSAASDSIGKIARQTDSPLRVLAKAATGNRCVANQTFDPSSSRPNFWNIFVKRQNIEYSGAFSAVLRSGNAPEITGG